MGLKSNIGLFADDSILHAFGPTLQKVEEELKTDLHEISKWTEENKVKIHQSKTKYCIISTCQKLLKSPVKSLDLTLDGKRISKTESERVLGVYIDNHLTWSVHIDILRRKLLKRISILARVRKHLPIHYRLLLYNANIKPLFEYCCTVWSNCSQSHLDDLFKLQKRCARLILDSPKEARSLDNFQKLQWLPIEKICEIRKLSLFHEIIDGRVPEYLIHKLE